MNNGNRRKMWKFIPTERRLEIVRMIEEMPAGLHKDVLTLCFIKDMSPPAAAEYAHEHNMFFIGVRRIQQIIREHIPDAWDYKGPSNGGRNPVHVPEAKKKKKQKNECERCGSTENLEVDHMIPLAICGETEEINLRVLCRECHKAWTTYQRKIFPEAFKWRKPKVVYDDGSEQLRME